MTFDEEFEEINAMITAMFEAPKFHYYAEPAWTDQPEPERMLYEFPRQMICERDWTPPPMRASGLFTESELASVLEPLYLSFGTVFPRYLAPFHAGPTAKRRRCGR